MMYPWLHTTRFHTQVWFLHLLRALVVGIVAAQLVTMSRSHDYNVYRLYLGTEVNNLTPWKCCLFVSICIL